MIRMDKLAQVICLARLRKALLAHRVLAGAEHRPVLAMDFQTVVDLGANRGQFALAARQWAPRARVISFEPLAGPAAVFNKIFMKDHLVALHQVAIGPDAGWTPIHIAAADDSSSILPISTLQQCLFPSTGEVRTETVRVGRLAEFLSPGEIILPALLKLDVQGYELQALAGCEDLLEHFSHVYAECSFVELYSGQALAEEIIGWLAKRKFRLSGVYNASYDKKGNAVQCDFLFTNHKAIGCRP
ncbi:MAG: Methyltransferase FkbM [Acidobacteria bacterium]|jgi:FkbM family methyltransferase|nr:Methyltransferase FkbM [Acidobacteriota bacterium]